jgi:hypothetical protein
MYGTASQLSGGAGFATTFYTTSTVFTVAAGTAYLSSATSWTGPSDSRTKKDISLYTTGLSDINQLTPATFVFNGEYGTPNTGNLCIGLIAQQVQGTPLAQFVLDTTTYVAPDGTETEIMTVGATPLIYALIGAVKTLTSRVSALEAKVGITPSP